MYIKEGDDLVFRVSRNSTLQRRRGKVTEEEWVVMRTHTTMGARIFANSPWPIGRLCEEIALTHHEKWDGSGYPRDLKREEIPLRGRIVALADVFHALTSERPYKKAFSAMKAVAIIREGKGTHFAPHVVDAFFRSLDEFGGSLKKTYREYPTRLEAGLPE